MLAVPDWVEHPDAHTAGVEALIKANAFKGKRSRWLEEDPTRVELIKWLRVAAEKNAFLSKTLNAYFDWGTLTDGREAAVRRARDEDAARKAECFDQAPEGPKGTIPFVIAAAAAGKAVVARRKALGHEPRPVVDTFPRFMAEAKRRERVCEAKQALRASVISERARDVIRIEERLNVGITERCAYQEALRAAEALAGPLNAGEKA